MVILNSILPDGGVEVALEEEGLGGEEEAGNTGSVDEDDGPESSTIAEEFGDDASDKYAESHADVPGDEDGGVGGSALIVAGHVDGHVLEGGPHVAVAEADEEGGAVVANFIEERGRRKEEGG